MESIGNTPVGQAQTSLAPSPIIERQEKTQKIAEVVQSDAKAQAISSPEIDKVELQDAVQRLNDFTSNNTERNLSFSLDETTQEMVVTVRDVKTLEVIKQMPTEEALAVSRQIESMLGLILNEKA